MDRTRHFLPRILPAPIGVAAVLAAAALVVAPIVSAQIGQSGSGALPADSAGSFEVSGVEVNVSAPTAEAARLAGWRIAQRKGWQSLSRRLGAGGALVSDSTLDAVVSGIVVENELIGPKRYIARLGVLFDRGRAASILGVASQVSRSAPLLVIPVQWSGGAGQVFERRSAWQEAWARFRTGNSIIDYVRPSGTGPDALLFNTGQVLRPSRGWWRAVLSQYGAQDVLVPVVRLYWDYPGGPVVGVFQARHGLDNRLLTSFTLRVATSDALPALLDEGVKRVDSAYQAALNAGGLRVDPSLAAPPPGSLPDPVDDEAAIDDAVAVDDLAVVDGGAGTVTINVQADTPNSSAVTTIEAVLRGVPGVRSAATTSLALGGISVVRVGYAGNIDTLRAALEARGWQVIMGSGALRIFRAAGPGLAPPSPAPDNAAQR